MALGKVQLPLWEKTSSPMLEPVVISKSPRETLSLSKTQQVSSCHSKGTGRWHQAGALPLGDLFLPIWCCSRGEDILGKAGQPSLGIMG